MKSDNTTNEGAGSDSCAPNCSAFEIRTLSDIFDLPTMEQMKTCLAELSDGMIQARATKDLMGSAADALGGSITVEWPEVAVWKDDGKGRIETRFTDKDGSGEGFAVVSQQNSEDNPSSVVTP